MKHITQGLRFSVRKGRSLWAFWNFIFGQSVYTSPNAKPFPVHSPKYDTKQEEHASGYIWTTEKCNPHKWKPPLYVRHLYHPKARMRIVIKRTNQNATIVNATKAKLNATFAICILFLHFDRETKSLLSLTCGNFLLYGTRSPRNSHNGSHPSLTWNSSKFSFGTILLTSS